MRILCSLVTLSLGLTVAASSGCGGKSEEGVAGSGGSAAGTGGTAGGSGGSAGALPDCAPPSDPSRAALCLFVEPEKIQFESDSQLDGRGFLVIQVYDTPIPDRPDGGPGVTPLLQQVHPPVRNDAGTVAAPTEQVLITEIPNPFRLDNLPPTAYVRAIFADNISTFFYSRPTWGTWLGGYDLSGGLDENAPIQPVQIPAGTGRSLRMPLVALRRLRATLSLPSTVTPFDDGEGPAWALAVRSATSGENEPIHGAASTPCARASSNPVVEGILVGSGTFYLAAGVDDYNLGGTVPRGGLVSFNVNGTLFSLPAASRVDVAPNAYTVDHTVPLNFLLPLEAGEIHAPFSCTTAGTGSSR